MLKTSRSIQAGKMRPFWSTAEMPPQLPLTIPNAVFWAKRGSPGTGSTWLDVSGNGNHGTIYDATWQSGGELEFDGVDSYVDFGNIGNPGSLDFSYLVRFKTTDENYALFAKSFYGGVANRFYMNQEGSGLQAILYTDTQYAVVPVGDLGDDQWHTVIVSHDRDGLMSLFVDGSLVDSVDITDALLKSIISSFHILVGRYNDGTDGEVPHPSDLKFSGQMSDVLLWFHAVDAEQAAGLHGFLNL